jgi:hypothetical protein
MAVTPSLQSLITTVTQFVQGLNAANKTFGQILRNIKPGILLGNSTDADGVLQAITLDGSLQFADGRLGVQRGIKTYTASHNLDEDDLGFRIEMDVGSANSLMIDPDTTTNFPIGSTFVIDEIGAGQTQIVAGSGVTLLSSGGATFLQFQYAQAELYKRAANEWLLTGDIAT